MPKIRVLPDILASQVAAGEVVERPASVVKELVENSIDAGAREIHVDIAKGGAAMIRVSDDGCGMAREDALLSLERHATSKLRTAGDLGSILTLGFRGEAVPSIASVSRFRMVTREAAAVSGTEILVDGGVLRDARDAGCAPGTVIEAKALFFNMPARRKFLRAETTEAAHIEQQLRLHALAAPRVRLRFRKDEREVFDLPGVARPIDRIRQFLATDTAGELIAIPRTQGAGIAVEGFVLPARHARKGRRHQCVFLNGRPIEDPAISRGLTEGFRGAIAEGLYPAAWLWIDMDPRIVDVNVHPAKREVRFHRPLDLKDLIAGALADACKPAPSPAPPPVTPVARVISAAAAFRPVEMELLSRPVAAPAPVSEVSPAPRFRKLGLLLGEYVVLESNDGLVLFDPRAAMERIHYERLSHPGNEGPETQLLLDPVLISLDPRDHETVLRERIALLDAGIEIDDFGGNTIQVRTIPAGLGMDDMRAFVGGLLDEALHAPGGSGRFSRQRLARVLAKRAAAAVVPRLDETDSLLARLFRCDLPYCTADGRPTLTEFSLKEIDRRFSAGT